MKAWKNKLLPTCLFTMAHIIVNENRAKFIEYVRILMLDFIGVSDIFVFLLSHRKMDYN